MADHLAPLTTQQRFPGRAFLRTFLQVLVGMPAGLLILSGVLAIVAQDQFAQYLPEGWVAWLLGASVFCAALAGLVARVMAVPAVDRLLKRAASSPEVSR